jgi:hypothetical protein
MLAWCPSSTELMPPPLARSTHLQLVAARLSRHVVGLHKERVRGACVGQQAATLTTCCHVLPCIIMSPVIMWHCFTPMPISSAMWCSVCGHIVWTLPTRHLAALDMPCCVHDDNCLQTLHPQGFSLDYHR